MRQRCFDGVCGARGSRGSCGRGGVTTEGLSSEREGVVVFVSCGQPGGRSCRGQTGGRKRVGGLQVEDRESWVGSRVDGRRSRADWDGGMGGLKFAGGNLGGDQGPASCACDRAASCSLLYAGKALGNRDRLPTWGPRDYCRLRRHAGGFFSYVRPVIHSMRPFPSARRALFFLPPPFHTVDMRQAWPRQVICRPSRAIRASQNSGPSHPCGLTSHTPGRC